MGIKKGKKINANSDALIFPDRAAFRAWLGRNGAESGGVWLLFGKKGGPVTGGAVTDRPVTLTAGEALEEALCFGWIDGLMKSIDSKAYKKYFSRRSANSKWSEKNKELAQKLQRQGKMTGNGRNKIEEAKKNGQWDKKRSPEITEEHIAFLSVQLKGREPAYTNFKAMSASVKKTYARAYFDAKTDAGREKRLEWMTGRLDKNLKPM